MTAPALAAAVLVVDDDADFRTLMQRTLERDGYRVTGVEDGPSALRALAAGRYDLALVDLDMPGMSGRELLSRCAEQELIDMAHVIVVSAGALRHASHAHWCLTKPVDPQLMLSVVRDFCGARRSLLF